MTTIDRIRRLAAMGFVVAAGLSLHLGVESIAMAQRDMPRAYVGFGPNHETESPGFGVPISPLVPNYGIAPVYPGPAMPHSRTPTAFFPMVPDSRLTFDGAFASGFGGFGGYGLGGYGLGGYGLGGYGLGGYGLGGYGLGGYGLGGYGLGGYGFGGYGYSGIGGGVSGYGPGMSLPPTPEFGPGTYRVGNSLPNPAVGMGLGGGNLADPAAGNVGPIPPGGASDDPFDNAASGRGAPTQPVRSHRVKAAHRPTVPKPTHPSARKVEDRPTDPAPSQLGTPGTRPQQASRPQEKPSTVKSEPTHPPRRRSMLGPPR